MTTETIEIKEGDIFRWRYRDEKPEELGPYRRYHCRSQIAVARDGLLVDTFWCGFQDNANWPYAVAAAKLELTYIGNFSDLDCHAEYMGQYFDDADCVNLNHSNSTKGNFYIRKGAKRSEAKMREVIAAEIEKEAAAIRVARSHIECLQDELAKIDGGTPLDQIYL